MKITKYVKGCVMNASIVPIIREKVWLEMHFLVSIWMAWAAANPFMAFAWPNWWSVVLLQTDLANFSKEALPRD